MRIDLRQSLNLLRRRGIASLRLLRLGHSQLVKQDFLQLFRRSEIQLRLIDEVASLTLRLIGSRLRLLAKLLECIDIHSDTGALHPAKHWSERNFQVGVHTVESGLIEFESQPLRQVDDGGDMGSIFGRAIEQGHLTVGLRKSLPQVSLDNVVQAVTALTWAQQVRGQESVVDDPCQFEVVIPECMHGRLTVMHQLRVVASEPRAQCVGIFGG